MLGNILLGLTDLGFVSIAVMIIWRREWATWKWLGIFCILSALIDGVLCLLRPSYLLVGPGHSRAYYYLYWLSAPIFTLLQVGILCTIYSVAIESFKVAPRQMRRVVSGIYAFFLGLFVLAAIDGGASWASVEKIAIAGNRVLAVMFAATLVLTVGYSAAIGLKWTSEVLLVDLGLLLGTAASVGWYALELLHPHANLAFGDMAERVVNFITVCIWLYAFVVPHNRGTANLEVRSQLARLFDRLSDPHKERNAVGTTV